MPPLIELSVLAATGNWLAVSATVVALAGVVAATLVMIRREGFAETVFPSGQSGLQCPAAGGGHITVGSTGW